MSTNDPFATPSPTPAAVPPAPPKRSRLRRFAFASALLVGGGVIGAVVAGPVIGQGYGWHDGPRWHHGYGPGMDDGPYRMGRGEFSGRGFGSHRMERGLDRVMWFIDATPEQRQKIKDVVGKTADDLLTLRGKHFESHKQLSGVLGAATIDRAKLDALRAEQMALAETASKRITDAVAQAAEVLTPVQRADLARWFDRWHRWRHG
jgi:protein CpxP